MRKFVAILLAGCLLQSSVSTATQPSGINRNGTLLATEAFAPISCWVHLFPPTLSHHAVWHLLAVTHHPFTLTALRAGGAALVASGAGIPILFALISGTNVGKRPSQAGPPPVINDTTLKHPEALIRAIADYADRLGDPGLGCGYLNSVDHGLQTFEPWTDEEQKKVEEISQAIHRKRALLKERGYLNFLNARPPIQSLKGRLPDNELKELTTAWHARFNSGDSRQGFASFMDFEMALKNSTHGETENVGPLVDSLHDAIQEAWENESVPGSYHITIAETREEIKPYVRVVLKAGKGEKGILILYPAPNGGLMHEVTRVYLGNVRGTSQAFAMDVSEFESRYLRKMTRDEILAFDPELLDEDSRGDRGGHGASGRMQALVDIRNFLELVIKEIVDFDVTARQNPRMEADHAATFTEQIIEKIRTNSPFKRLKEDTSNIDIQSMHLKLEKIVDLLIADLRKFNNPDLRPVHFRERLAMTRRALRATEVMAGHSRKLGAYRRTKGAA